MARPPGNANLMMEENVARRRGIPGVRSSVDPLREWA
jgi:hypothetical protein